MSRSGNLEGLRRLAVARGWGRRFGVSFRGNENVLRWAGVMVVQRYDYTHNH